MLARQYARRGHKVVAYSRHAPGLAAAETDNFGIRHVRVRGHDINANVWLDHVNALRYATRVWRVLEPADVTTFHTPFSFLLRHKAGIGATTHTIHRTPKWIVRFYRGLDRLYGGSNAVVEQALAIDPKLKNLKRIYNCISIPEQMPRLRADYSGGLTFLYVGRFVPDKGIEALIKGFQAALPEFPTHRLVTIGPQSSEGGADGPFFDSMAAYVREQKLDHAISLLPPIFDRQKLNERIGAADVICVPTITGETFSMAILEAMALAKPILTSDFPPMLEAVDHRVNGYVAKSGDSSSIAEAIRYFSQLGAGLNTLGVAAFEKVKNNFSDEIIAGEYLADFSALAEAHAPHSV
jgi:glycosyltransferase involved in cell wall biosynthesis